MDAAVRHIDLVVSSLEASLDFYRGLLFPLGWSDGDRIVGERGEPVYYLAAPPAEGAIGLGLRERQSSDARPYDRYSIGLHHIAFHVASRAVVDERAGWLKAQGAEIESVPIEHDYRPGYYAVFFYDPDGLKLELVHRPTLSVASEEALAEGAGYVLRDAAVADAAAIAPLLEELGYPATSDQVEERLGRLEMTPNERLLIATGSDGVLGLASMRIEWPIEHDAPACRLTALVVASSARRRGVGGTLVRTIEQLAQRVGCSQIVLSSRRTRADAHAFYERLGYEATSFGFKKRLDAA
ncbi:MAG: GNAT family N-acetyltransferase [Actinobacteria bacterium]|nr:GNAT family N-acetyltransferase [Actinomycetota bacterium]